MTTNIPRREMLGLLAASALAAACDRASRSAQGARETTRETGEPYQPTFFTAHEWATVGVLVDLIIPPDERSGGATEAGVPEFMDFMMLEYPDGQTAMRGGLAWIDAACGDRFGRSFVECSDAERRALLDEIAWPDRAPPELSQGVAFFNEFRDLTASGFWSSKMGVADLQYRGNAVVPAWTGCPEAALKKLGVSYG